jgi:hypothetical protein
MPIIAIELDEARTEVLDLVAREQRRNRKAQTLVFVEDALDRIAEENEQEQEKENEQ